MNDADNRPAVVGQVERSVRPSAPLVERLRAFVALDGGDIADVEEAIDELEQMQATLEGLREMAEDGADRGDVFAQRVLRALGPNV